MVAQLDQPERLPPTGAAAVYPEIRHRHAHLLLLLGGGRKTVYEADGEYQDAAIATSCIGESGTTVTNAGLSDCMRKAPRTAP